MSIENLQGQIFELNEKLQQRNYDLINCKKENEEFIHIASHDLQAPLRKLSTFVERLTQKTKNILNEETLVYIDRIQSTVTDMRSLVDGLSALSEIDTDIDLIKCDLNKIIKEAISDIEILIKEKHAEIAFPSLPTIEANGAQIKIAFKNLLENSIKFQNEGATPQINIMCELLSSEERTFFNLPVDKIYYKIEFADNGIGFKQEYADKILKPFQRLHGKSSYKGNGLGLAICKKIIDQHHGIFYAKGNENAGATFILILPQTFN